MIIVAIIAAVGVWYVTKPVEEEEEEEEPEDGPFSREQTFVWAEKRPGPMASLNPITEFRVTVGVETPLVYEPLAMINAATWEWMPHLAEEWSWVDDYTFEIKIRPEAYFRKGQPVTAEDVKFSLETTADPTVSGLITSTFAMIESVEVVDEKTLRLHVIEEGQPPQNPQVLLLLTAPTRIFEKEEWSELLEEYGEDISEYANLDPEKVNGSGPYTLLSSTPESAIWVRVDNYWGNQLGWYHSPKYYQCIFVETEAIALSALELGDADMADVTTFTTDWIEERKHPDGWLWGYNPGGDWDVWKDYEMCAFFVVPNPEIEIFRHDWMRYAIAYAIDYKKTDEVGAAGGLATRTGPYFLPIPTIFPWIEYYNSDIVDQYFDTETVAGVSVIKYDPEKAVEILQANCEGSVEEGWTYNGGEIGPFEVLAWAGAGGVEALSEIIAKNLRDIGIEATVDAADWGLYLERTESGVFDFDVRWALNGLRGPPRPIAQGYTEVFLVPGDCWQNSKFDYWKYWNGEYPPLGNTADQVRELIDSLWALEPGSDESIAVVREIQEIYIPQLPAIPLSGPISPTMISTRYWANLPYGDDPLDWLTKNYNWFYGTVKHIYPECVETVSATLSQSTVEAGEPTTVEVTLKNNGGVTHLYPVYVHKGPAEPGLHDEDIIAHGTIKLGAGQTRTIELEVTIDTPGTYTLTVDDWRYSEWDPGDPIERTLTVE